MMYGLKGGPVTSLPPPQPKSPPELYGRRRELAKVQVLEREIGFLEEELKSIEGLQLASRSCKEVTDFVTANADPLIPTTKKIRSSCGFWKWLCGGISCFKVSCVCCCSCPSRPKMPSCCECDTCRSCAGCCRMPDCCSCFSSCCNGKCFEKSKCSTSCCCCCCCSVPKCPSCTTCSSSCCTGCCTCYPDCLKFKNLCSCCQKSCCYPCYFCY